MIGINKTMNKTIKELGVMVLVGAIIGVMFNIALLDNDPLNMGGIFGGFITGILMYTFS